MEWKHIVLSIMMQEVRFTTKLEFHEVQHEVVTSELDSRGNLSDLFLSRKILFSCSLGIHFHLESKFLSYIEVRFRFGFRF